jgi:hypothetical protein
MVLLMPLKKLEDAVYGASLNPRTSDRHIKGTPRDNCRKLGALLLSRISISNQPRYDIDME